MCRQLFVIPQRIQILPVQVFPALSRMSVLSRTWHDLGCACPRFLGLIWGAAPGKFRGWAFIFLTPPFSPITECWGKKKNRESKMMQWLKAENGNTNSVADSADWFAILSVRKNAFFYTYVVQGWKMFSVLLSSERWGGSSFPPLVWNQFLLLVSKITRRTVVQHNWDSQNQLIFWWGLLCKLMATVYSELFAC